MQALTSIGSIVSNPDVLRTVMGTMAITAVLAALPKPGTKPTWGLIYKFCYESLLGFWSLKTGHPIQPLISDPAPAPNPTLPETPAHPQP